MIKESVKSASTIEDAKAAALLELGLTEDDVYNIEVLQMPQKKTFGIFGGKPAEVKVWVDVPEKKEKPVSEKNTYKKPASAPKKVEDRKKETKKENTRKVEKEEKTEEEKKASLKETNEYEKTASYIAEIVKGLGLSECSVKTFADDEEIVFELDCGDDYGIVIGRRGETLDAIQYLARMVANRGVSGYKRVSINIGNYREKRARTLEALARKLANQAVRTGRSITLEPMNPYERHIIHTAIAGMEGVRSESKGEGPARHVVLYSTDPDACNLPDRDNARNQRGPRRDGQRGPRRDNRGPRGPRAPREGGRGPRYGAPRRDRNDRGPRYGGPRSSVPGREFADRPRDPDAKPMAPKTTERIHDGDDFAFGKIEF